MTAHQYNPPAIKDHRGIQARRQQWRAVECRSRGGAGSESSGGWSKPAGYRGARSLRRVTVERAFERLFIYLPPVALPLLPPLAGLAGSHECQCWRLPCPSR